MTMRSVVRCSVVVLVIAAACGKNQQPPPPSSGVFNAQPESGPRQPRPQAAGASAPGGQGGQGAAMDKAQKMFATVCATCHGMEGRGDGPAAASLNPKPRNYTDPKWQASVTDDQLRETILKGGQGTGKSAMMPGQPQLKDEPEVLDALVKVIRGFGQGPAAQ
jgi:cytochrome c553